MVASWHIWRSKMDCSLILNPAPFFRELGDLDLLMQILPLRLGDQIQATL